MVNYLSGELYKLTRRRGYLAGFLGFMLGGITLFFLLMRANAGPGATFGFFAGVFAFLLSTGIYLVVVACDMVFSDQYKHNTLKNEVSYGLPRTRIYLGKLTAAFLAALVLCGIITVWYLVLARILFPWAVGDEEVLRTLLDVFAVALPLWLGGLGLFLMLLFALRGSTMATIVYVFLVGGLDGVLDMVSIFLPKFQGICQAIQSCLLQAPLNDLFSSSPDVARAWLVGMGWFFLSTGIGLVVFRKREIS